MTNAEKFSEVFGTDLKRQYSTKSWWDQEFVPTKTEKVSVQKIDDRCKECEKDWTKCLKCPVMMQWVKQHKSEE